MEAVDPTRLPLHGGDATTVVITIDLAALKRDLASATLPAGTHVPGDAHETAPDEQRITAGEARRPGVLLLHGTFWSRVWQPILPALEAVADVVAPDYPGFGRSDGELDVPSASVPALAELTRRLVDVLGWSRYSVFGHDIGGGMAQHLAVHDARTGEVHLVRDRIVVKPLYWTQVDGQLRFASELTALLVDPAVPRAVDAEGLAELLTLSHLPAPRTPLAGVRALPPATVLTWRAGRVCSRPTPRPA